jgi:hypothetical protein
MLNTYFISHACDVLTDEDGLTEDEMSKHFRKFVVRNDIHIEPIEPTFKFDRWGNNNKKLHRLVSNFEKKEQLAFIKFLCDLPQFEDNEDVCFLRNKLEMEDSEIIKETNHLLKKYPKAKEQYDSALEKYGNGVYERNTLDDMRLSFELFLKDLLNNNKSIENNKNELCGKLKEFGISSEFRNIFENIMRHYIVFNNDNVKHDDKIKANEIEFVIEFTSIMIKFVIKVLGSI